MQYFFLYFGIFCNFRALFIPFLSFWYILTFFVLFEIFNSLLNYWNLLVLFDIVGSIWYFFGALVLFLHFRVFLNLLVLFCSDVICFFLLGNFSCIIDPFWPNNRIKNNNIHWLQSCIGWQKSTNFYSPKHVELELLNFVLVFIALFCPFTIKKFEFLNSVGDLSIVHIDSILSSGF